jgi:hypothetical protein
MLVTLLPVRASRVPPVTAPAPEGARATTGADTVDVVPRLVSGLRTVNANAEIDDVPRSCSVWLPAGRSFGTVKGYVTRPLLLALVEVRVRGTE